jgi:hypothetical protein
VVGDQGSGVRGQGLETRDRKSRMGRAKQPAPGSARNEKTARGENVRIGNFPIRTPAGGGFERKLHRQVHGFGKMYT